MDNKDAALARFDKKWTLAANGCHIWTDETHGRPTFWFDSRTWKAARWIFWHTHGREPEVARHTCDNWRCVRSSHIIDGTHADNMNDMGERGRGSSWKLDAAAVVTIRDLWARNLASQEHLADMFGVDKSTIAQVVRRNTWSEAGGAEADSPEAASFGRRKTASSASAFKGVSFDKTNPRLQWAAYIVVSKKKRRLGRHLTQEDAARAYDAAARAAWGKDARLNFPETGERGI